jgi:hypothetical protein
MLGLYERGPSQVRRRFRDRYEEAALIIIEHGLRPKRHLQTALLALAVTGLTMTYAAAQPWPGTQNVNDCTLLREPDLMRRCIEAYQGAPAGPSTTAPTTSPMLLPQTPAPSPSPVTPAPVAPPPRLAPR